MEMSKKYKVVALICFIVIVVLLDIYLIRGTQLSTGVISEKVALTNIDTEVQGRSTEKKTPEEIALLIQGIYDQFGGTLNSPSIDIVDFAHFQTVIHSVYGGTFFTHDKGGNYGIDLYFFDNKSKELAKIYSGIIDDCCGGGMPHIEDTQQGSGIIVSSGTGDECYSEGQEILFQKDGKSGPYRMTQKVLYGNDCATEYLTYTFGSTEYEIQPEYKGSCTKYDGTESISLVGVKAITSGPGFIYSFDNPIQTKCIKNPEYGDGVDKYVSYRNVGLGSPVHFDVVIGYFDNGKYTEPYSYSLSFDWKTGFKLIK